MAMAAQTSEGFRNNEEYDKLIKLTHKQAEYEIIKTKRKAETLEKLLKQQPTANVLLNGIIIDDQLREKVSCLTKTAANI